MQLFRIFRGVVVIGWATSLLVTEVPAQTDSPAADPEVTAVENEQEQLHLLEQALLNDYKRFEEKLLELAEYTRRTDPDRAQLLRDARSKSTSLRIAAQMERIAQALSPTDSGDVLYGDAETRQDELLTDLVTLLKHLQSEDERDRLAAEIARLQDLLKDTQRLIGQEKDVRADTERRGNSQKLQGDQKRVTERADALAEKIDQQDAERRADDEQRAAERHASEAERGDTPDDGESSESERDSSEPEDSRESKEPNSEGDPQESSDDPSSKGQEPQESSQKGAKQQSQGQQQQQSQQQQQQQTPGRQQLEEARERMQRAIEQLQQEQLEKASDEQDAAIAKLEEMKAELEEILRQLREEEQKLFLAMLEARFKRMLELQLDINNGTLKLDQVSPDERDEDRHLAQSTKLSRDQDKNMTEAERALVLLKEEGSSVAFPEAVEMMRDNMQAVSGRLQRGLTDETTQLVERLIVEALEEMVFALQREMEKQDQQQEGDGEQGAPTDPALVDALAELKMIRSLQLQINRLTQQYGKALEGEQATDPDDLKFLQNLGARQSRVERAAYDLSVGKNR